MTTPFFTLFALLSDQAFAGVSYSDQVGKLKANDASISTQIRTLKARYGFSESSHDHLQNPADSDARKTKLIQVHADLRGGVLSAGKLLFGKTISRLVVSSEGAPALIELSDHQGGLSQVRLLGVARAGSTVGRLTIDFQKLLFRSQTVAIQATALDEQGAQGLVADVFSSKAWAVAGAMAGSFISGLASAQQTQSMSALGFSQPQPTGRNALLQGVAQSAADQSRRFIEESTAEKPVLVVEPETPVTVLIQEEVRY